MVGLRREPQRILVVRLDNVGDVVMLTPALRALRHRFPSAHITLLASPAGAAAAPLLPWVNEVRVLRALWQQLDPDPARWPVVAERSEIADIERGAFDIAYLFTSFAQSPHPPAYFCYLAGIPVRVGESKEFGGGVLTDAVPTGPDDEHQVDRNLRLLASVGVPAVGDALELALPPIAVDRARALIEKVGIGWYQPYAVLAPGASASARRWSPERFGQLGAGLDRLGLTPVVVGGPADRERALIAARACGAPSLAGLTSLPELAALIARAGLVVTNNSAPMHIAEALGRPTVVLFAGTELERQWAPRHTPARLLRRPTSCAPCYQLRCPTAGECLDLAPAEVLVAADELWTANGGAAAGCNRPVAG